MQIGARWLQQWCQQAGAAPTEDDALATAVARILLTHRGGDEAAAELFDLLGDGAFDAIQRLLANRWDLPTTFSDCPQGCSPGTIFFLCCVNLPQVHAYYHIQPLAAGHLKAPAARPVSQCSCNANSAET